MSTFKTPLKGFLTIQAFHSTPRLRLAVSGVGSSRTPAPEEPVTGQWAREGSGPARGVPGKLLLRATRASPSQARPWPPAGQRGWVRPPLFFGVPNRNNRLFAPRARRCPHPAPGPTRFRGQRPKRPLLRLRPSLPPFSRLSSPAAGSFPTWQRGRTPLTEPGQGSPLPGLGHRSSVPGPGSPSPWEPRRARWEV